MHMHDLTRSASSIDAWLMLEIPVCGVEYPLAVELLGDTLERESSGFFSPTCFGSTTRNRYMTRPKKAMTAAGTTKDQPHPKDSMRAANSEPRMFPTDVWEFHSPMMRPRLPLPYHSAMTDTTLGQPVA